MVHNARVMTGYITDEYHYRFKFRKLESDTLLAFDPTCLMFIFRAESEHDNRRKPEIIRAFDGKSSPISASLGLGIV